MHVCSHIRTILSRIFSENRTVPPPWFCACNKYLTKIQQEGVVCLLSDVTSKCPSQSKHYKFLGGICPFCTFFRAMAVPAIIVQGGGFGKIVNHDIHREQTKRAASVGYDVLIVSVCKSNF